MDKKHLTLLQFDQKVPKTQPKREALVEKKWLLHLESEECKLTRFNSGKDHAQFVFTYQGIDFVFQLDFVVDTLILDFEGAGLSEFHRIQASKLLERIIESLRFRHKDKYWSLSHYYIDNLKRYEERKNPSYPVQYHNEWKRIIKLAKMEIMDDSDRLFMEVEDIHDLELKIVGEDGKVLCAYLKENGFIDYHTTYENECIIEFLDPTDELDNINRKIVFAREVAYFGYNIWVDYPED